MPACETVPVRQAQAHALSPASPRLRYVRSDLRLDTAAIVNASASTDSEIIRSMSCAESEIMKSEACQT